MMPRPSLRKYQRKTPKLPTMFLLYVLGDTNQIQRASDNGEPSGTAGAPTLEALLQHDLRDVVAVTTRYFGGIKLGAGGLIRAYAGNANTAIETIGIVARIKQKL